MSKSTEVTGLPEPIEQTCESIHALQVGYNTEIYTKDFVYIIRLPPNESRYTQYLDKFHMYYH